MAERLRSRRRPRRAPRHRHSGDRRPSSLHVPGFAGTRSAIARGVLPFLPLPPVLTFLPIFPSLALGPHPQRELTLMLALGFAWPRARIAAGAPYLTVGYLMPSCSRYVRYFVGSK